MFIQKKIKIKIILFLCRVFFLLFPLNLYSEEPERILRKDSLAFLDSIGQVKKSHMLNSVTITGRKWAKISRYSALSMPLTTLDILTTPAALGDILGGLRVVPSAQTNDADGRLQVAGGRPEETETYMDGLLVSHSTSMGMNNQGVRSRFSPELFEDISLQAGGYSAASGHALSGLIDLKTNSLPTESKKLTLGISTTGLSLAKTFGCKQHRFYTKASYTDLSIFSAIEKLTITISILMIETSFLYHSFGVRDIFSTRCEYKGNKTIIHVRFVVTPIATPTPCAYLKKAYRIIWLFKILFVISRITKKKGELE